MIGSRRRRGAITGPVLDAGTLVVEGIEAGYDLAPVLQGIHLRVEAGEFVAIVGLNGSGKSTLFKAVFGQLKTRRGKIWWDGERIDRLPCWDRVRRGIAHVPQGRLLFTELTVRENLELGALPTGAETARLAQGMALVFDLFPRLHERVDQRVGLMSGGEQQMVAIGRGLMAEPRLLLLDEVSLGLSPKLALEVAAALGRIKELGIAVLAIEHRPWLLEANADRACFMERGAITWHGTIDDALDLGKVEDFYLIGADTPEAAS